MGGGKGWGLNWRHRWFRRRLGEIIWVAIATLILVVPGLSAQSVSNYDLAQTADFNRLESYPVEQLPSRPNYRPVGEWSGRLILPTVQEYAAAPGDWVWLEVWHSPIVDPNLVGERVKLTWLPGDERTAYVEAVTQDVHFNQQARQFQAGNIVPTRLDGRTAVGPLQSLAGARPRDDVTVRLVDPQLVPGPIPELQVGWEPIQMTGREYALVQILGIDADADQPLPQDCPGPSPCPSEYFRVRHYRSQSGQFDGDVETVRIPQQPRLQGDRFFSTVRRLEQAPVGQAGWYIYGARNQEGTFTVQALKPRSLFQLQPDGVLLGQRNGLHYIDRLNWEATPERKGTAQRILVSPNLDSAEVALSVWQEGDSALVVHLFGGIGGENPEHTPAGTVTGHFAYGLARVVREPITDELQFEIQYQQIYAHNSNGILSGIQDWSAYAGDLQRGWIGQRPFSDVVIKQAAFLQPLQLGKTRLHLFRELLVQAQVMAARYRIGDGTGVAAVTPATSCVQDSSQALYIAMEQIKHKAHRDPAMADWIAAHADSPEVQRLNQFVALGTALGDMLTPYGTVRPDWQANADALAGVNNRDGWVTSSSLINSILSWQNMMPRWGQEAVLRVFLAHDAQLWFLRSNQLGGYDPTIAPIAPTSLFGRMPLLGTGTQRLTQAFAAPMTADDWAITLLALIAYGAIALPYGLITGFLRFRLAQLASLPIAVLLGRLLVAPALLEEVVFRVWLLPHPLEGIVAWRWWAWGLLSLGLFVLYHQLNARLFPGRTSPLADHRFTLLTVLLGLGLTVVYWLTGSLWPITLLHWSVISIWRLGGGGYRQFPRAPSPADSPL